MIGYEIIKELRKKYSLTQEELGRAVFLEGASISQYENGKRKLTIETLESIVNVFGYTIDLSLIEKLEGARNKHFYQDKASEEIVSMKKEDMVDYLLVKGDKYKLMSLCDVDSMIYDILNPEQIKNLLLANIQRLDKLMIYNVLEENYPGYDKEMMIFIKNINEYIEAYKDDILKNLPQEMLDSIYYILVIPEMGNDMYWRFNDLRFLDKKKIDLNIDRELFEPVCALEDEMGQELMEGLGSWLYCNDTIRIKY